MTNSCEDIDWDRWVAKDLATLLFIVKRGRVLLIRKKRGLGAGKVNGPGGKIEPGESPAECAVREVEEELRVSPTGLRHHGEHRFQFIDGYSLHCHVFTATDCVGTPTETEEAIPLWTPIDAIPYDEMWADDRHWLPAVLQGHSVDGRYVFDEDRLVDMALKILPISPGQGHRPPTDQAASPPPRHEPS